MIKMNMEQMTQEEVEEADQVLDSSIYRRVWTWLISDVTDIFPLWSTFRKQDFVTSILTRYTDIIFDNVAGCRESWSTGKLLQRDVSWSLSVWVRIHVTQAEALPWFQQILLDTACLYEEKPDGDY